MEQTEGSIKHISDSKPRSQANISISNKNMEVTDVISPEAGGDMAVERGEVEDPGALDNLGGNCSFVAGFDADSTAKEGDRIEVLVDTRALHFFDRETRNAIWDDA